MHLYEKKIEGVTLYQGSIITVEKDRVLLENEKEANREVVRHPGGVCVCALNDKDEIYLVKQFRYPYGKVVTELPAGKLDRKGESPLEAAKRELLEETGVVAKTYKSLGTLYPSPGYCDEVIHLFAAKDLSFANGSLDEDEFLDVLTLPFEEAAKMVIDGELPDSKTQTTILKVKFLKEQGLL